MRPNPDSLARPRRGVLNALSIAVTVTGIVAILASHTFNARGHAGLDNLKIDRLNDLAVIITVMLVILAAANTTFITWATVVDARQSSALAHAFGATPRQVSAGLSAAQLLPALPGIIVGIPGGDERVPQRVGRDGFGDPRAARNFADDPPGAVPVQPPSVGGEEDGPVTPFPGGQVDRPGGARRERNGDDLAALADDRQGPVPALQAQMLDIGASSLGHSQPVQGEQGNQRVLQRRANAGGDQHGAEFVAVQGGGMRLVVQPRAADVRGRGMI